MIANIPKLHIDMYLGLASIVPRSIRFYSKKLCKYNYKMKTVYFRHVPGEAKLEINFRYINNAFNMDRDFNFVRDVSENIKVCTDRIKTNIEKNLKKKVKKGKSKPVDCNAMTQTENVEIAVHFVKDNVIVDDHVRFNDILNNAGDLENNLVLKIANEDFFVFYNTPHVSQVKVPMVILARFLIYPYKLKLEFATMDTTRYHWYRGIMSQSCDINSVNWEQVHEGFIYTVTNNDIGYLIKLKVVPGDGTQIGIPIECISTDKVMPGPGVCPFEIRHQFTPNKLNGNLFRISSYNILADLYADSDYSKKELFPYCPPYALKIDYRKQLIIKEILGYNSDIVCLQEVDKKVFDLTLKPVLGNYKYSGNFQEKGKTSEGLAIFYDEDRFTFIRKHECIIGESLDKLDVFTKVWTKIKDNVKLVERMSDLGTTLQVCLLQSKDNGHYFLVANTHLYFHPDADHIRLLQGGLCMIYLDQLYKTTLSELNLKPNELSLIFCGDFNSVPECGIYKLMIEKHVSDSFVDWSSNREERVEGVTLHQPFNMESACGCPDYTNFTTLFNGCLDYIFYQMDNLEVQEVIPFPTHEQILCYEAIPSVVAPSDHIALVVNIKVKQFSANISSK